MTHRGRLLALACSAFAGLLSTAPALAATPLQHPSGLVIDSTGVLWVANSGANTVQSYDVSSLPPTPGLAITQDLSNPTALATYKGKLYVANTKANTVTVYQTKTGSELTSATITGLDHPLGVAVDTQGDVLVANGASNTVAGFTAQGTSLGSVGADTNSAFVLPTALRIQNGTLFLGLGPRVGTDSIREYDPTTFFAGTPTPKMMLTTDVSGPTGVTLSRDGRFLLVANLYTSTVWRYRATTGAPISAIARDISGPEGIVVDNLGRIFVSNAKTSTVSVFTAKGVFITSF